MMVVWLSPDEIANRLSIPRRSAMNLMHQMPYSVIGGTYRKRIRVAETDFEDWMLKKQPVARQTTTVSTGCKKRLERRK